MGKILLEWIDEGHVVANEQEPRTEQNPETRAEEHREHQMCVVRVKTVLEE